MLDSYIGIPFQSHGRTRAGCDCWGLLRLVYTEQLGLELPSFAEDYVTSADREAIAGLIAGNLGGWSQIPAGHEQALDGVLMRGFGGIGHIGVVVQPGLVLHVQFGCTSRIERYRSGPLAQRVRGLYRYTAPVIA
ncbi:hypothetical protein; putative tail assembly protein homolog [Bradyrhizobium sp. ORS 278]|uniref:NlpC/P60 family protein n=1 Tax=Bradyrhizobium sp. (strain ORS 278) TaxID=114615 RepID=UPI0001508F51|nr:NlpC/P60 family protein [Bradyrhizobium sp. ORS 278]CAL77422.1 hypothetical protein; putative tail assembly protein homolog [Bradyrhizobium sp. ORS 278]